MQGLSNVAWAFARIHARVPLLTGIAAESTSRLNSFTAQGVSNLCWALAKLQPGTTDVRVLDAIESHACANFPDYSSQAVSLVLWGLAKQGRSSPRLLKLVTHELVSCSSQFVYSSIAPLITAFAMMEYKDKATIDAVVRHCDENLEFYRHRPDFLCSLLWALAQLEVPGSRCLSLA
jgi:hypothetical protein